MYEVLLLPKCKHLQCIQRLFLQLAKKNPIFSKEKIFNSTIMVKILFEERMYPTALKKILSCKQPEITYINTK